jgi:hypothetical protein
MVVYDGIFTSVQPFDPTAYEAQEFNTFTEAKQVMVSYLEAHARDYKLAAREARKLRKDDIT